MTTEISQNSDVPAPQALYKTATGQRRHIARCPHIVGKHVAEASDGPICEMSQAELSGVGREYFDDLATALPALGAFGDTWSEILRVTAPVEHDAVWIPNSRSYIALGRNGHGVAWVGKTYVDIAGGARVELPGYAPGSGGGAPQDLRRGPVCKSCFMETPLSGVHHCS
ncbi:hypothetical protein [Modestobacter sp. VKM Ac-2978]|uniref:hypothetical protein n=1 Tax=Modestobacter sp. VKM Ac-2978 TaxID=3004132 RepID=UPI0022AB10A2|nr:hypothetical protein [Modestobacter sp. VKM Ac-2978]MCZ2849140.1 hypothetical protein [Modestobacter sp. VKM Ac-2978]